MEKSFREAALAKGREALESTQQEFYVKAKAAKFKHGNVDGVLAGPTTSYSKWKTKTKKVRN